MNRNRNLLITTSIAAMLALPMAAQAGDDKAADMAADTAASTSQTDRSETGDMFAEARDDVATAWEDFKAYTGEKLQPAVDAGDDLLKAMDRRIDSLGESDAGMEQPENDDKVAEMRTIRDDIAGQLEAAETEHREGWSEQAWNDFKASLGAAVDEFQDLFDETAYDDGEPPYQDKTAAGDHDKTATGGD